MGSSFPPFVLRMEYFCRETSKMPSQHLIGLLRHTRPTVCHVAKTPSLVATKLSDRASSCCTKLLPFRITYPRDEAPFISDCAISGDSHTFAGCRPAITCCRPRLRRAVPISFIPEESFAIADRRQDGDGARSLERSGSRLGAYQDAGATGSNDDGRNR